MWEKEKLLFKSNFSFSHSVFKRLVSQGRQKVSLCGNHGLNLSSMYTDFNTWKKNSFNDLEKKKPFENIVGKEKMLATNILSFSHNDFYPIREK